MCSFRKPKYIYFRKDKPSDGHPNEITFQMYASGRRPTERTYGKLPRAFRIVRGSGEIHIGNILCSLDNPQVAHIVNFHPVISTPHTPIRKKRYEERLSGFLYSFEKLVLMHLFEKQGAVFWHSYKREYGHENALKAVGLNSNGKSDTNMCEAIERLDDGIERFRFSGIVRLFGMIA